MDAQLRRRAVEQSGRIVIGLHEGMNRTIGRLGSDSALVLAVYAAGLVALSRI